MNNNYMNLGKIDENNKYTDRISMKIKRLQKEIKDIQSPSPLEKKDCDEPIDIKQEKLRIRLIGLWQLTELNGEDKKEEKVFYNMNRSEINVLPYGGYKKYKNYKYILRNNNVYFGNGPFAVIIEEDIMKLDALDFNCKIEFIKVTVEDIKNILSSKTTSSSMTSHNLRFYDDYSIKDILVKFKWKTYAYMYGNDSISYDLKSQEYIFNSDKSFSMTNESGKQYGKYDVIKRALDFTYDDGFNELHKTVFVEYNRKFEHYYLYVSEQCDRYEGCYSVYVSC